MTQISFDWKLFCEQNRIAYVVKGANVSKNNIGIKCPFCADDPSEHLGLSLNKTKPYWGCFRSTQHRGKDPTKLIMVLTGCSFDYAKKLLNAQHLAFDNMASVIDKLRNPINDPAVHQDTLPQCTFPHEIKPIGEKGFSPFFHSYLKHRGFNDTRGVCGKYQLRYCLSGRHANRIIIPFFDEEKTLIGWTGRAVIPSMKVRYLTHYDPPSRAQGHVWFPDYNKVKNSSRLVITEGPFDAMKLDWYIKNPAVVICSLLGKQKATQIPVLVNMIDRYDFVDVTIMLDQGEHADSMRLADVLSGYTRVTTHLVYDTKDPGELSQSQIRSIFP